ncbi:alpha/beta hydrolase [Streptacidiphilus sp. NEAU-YB345]|uniref:Alpha/beta hydrolase n=1 Tax=Streptacidiphilus fuscans TaxID=2789292 RepID=A0A931F9J8_9ACTN|nr:alpha/beta hydrolase [Streptacidiphilus fuscans]
MALDPVVARLVAASATPPGLDDLGPVAGRQALLEAQGDDRVEDCDVETAFRVAPVRPSGLVGYWTFRPVGVTTPRPILLYVHGGRWMLGDAHTHARLITELVRRTGAVALVPEYSRTPEARYPVALEECYALLTWAVENADELGLRADRTAVAGDCAGATLATAVTMLAHERGGPRLRAQLLYYPLTDARCDSESHRRFSTGYLLTSAALRHYWEEYLGSPDKHALATASPSRATDELLRGLPPALVVTAEADVARDEGEQYAARLREAGVEATAVRFLGTVHDFVALNALRDSPPSLAAVEHGSAFLRARLC